MAENNIRVEEPEVKAGFVVKLRQLYRDYRTLRRSRHEKPKEKLRFQKRLQFYSQFISKGDLCFDVGANIGNHTRVFVQIGATVVVVEPQKSCWRVLKKRFGDNDSVHLINKGLGKTIGKNEFFIDRSHTLSSMSKEWISSVKSSGRFSFHHTWEVKTTVETTTLDLLIEEYGKPDFCKIDVEGFEFEVLQGLSQPIGTISFEFIPEHLGPVLRCIEYLSKLGKTEFNYSLAESMNLALPGWVSADDMMRILSTFPATLGNYGDIYVRFPEYKIR